MDGFGGVGRSGSRGQDSRPFVRWIGKLMLSPYKRVRGSIEQA